MVIRSLFDSMAARPGGRGLRILVCAMLLAACLPAQALAEGVASEWHIRPHIYLAGMTTWLRKQDTENSHDTIATAAELRFRSDALPWHANLFVEYKFSSTKRYSDIVNLGAYFRYDWRDWDVTTAIYHEHHAARTKRWIYAGRLRHRIAPQHKIGVQTAGSFTDSVSPPLHVGYYGSISEALSLHVIADPGINGGPDIAIRTELVWQLR